VQSANFSAIQPKLEEQWKKLDLSRPLHYNFLEDAFAKVYQSEKKIGLILQLFSTLALFILCLGLIGLLGFIINQRIREISIRKVFGATTSALVVLFKWIRISYGITDC
jgi:putative ABC transport system permease protein